MSIIIFAIILSLLISFSCSLAEAALYAVPVSHLKLLSEKGSKSARLLLRYKADMAKPITAILILNTVSNAIGPAVSGAYAAKLYGDSGLIIVSGVFSILILAFGELVPKIIGVNYAKSISAVLGFPISFLATIFSPIIWLSRGLTSGLSKAESSQPSISLEELLTLTNLGREEGALDHFEGSVIANVIGLDKLLVRDVQTPRVVVFRMEENTTLAEIEDQVSSWTFSRIPLYSAEDEEHLTGYVIQRDVYRSLLKGEKTKKLKELTRPIHVVPELIRVDQLLLQMFERKEQICAVVDEHGGLSGIITLEDIIEEVVGREIVDEYDSVSDLRTFAKFLKYTKGRKKG